MFTILGPSPSAVLTTLQSTFHTIEDWCKEYRLEISKDKLVLMPKFIRKGEVYKSHPTIVAKGINVVSKMRWNNTRFQVGLVSPHTSSRKQATAYSQQP